MNPRRTVNDRSYARKALYRSTPRFRSLTTCIPRRPLAHKSSHPFYHPNCSQCNSTPGPSPRIKLAVTSRTVLISPRGPHAATNTRPVAGVVEMASRMSIAVSGRPGWTLWPWLCAVASVLVERRLAKAFAVPAFSGSEEVATLGLVSFSAAATTPPLIARA